MRRERDVKQAIKRHLDSVGAWHTSPYQAGMTQAGVPDIIACVAGVFVGIECKFGSNKPTRWQDIQLSAIKSSGGTAVVCNEQNIDDVKQLISHLAVGAG